MIYLYFTLLQIINFICAAGVCAYALTLPKRSFYLQESNKTTSFLLVPVVALILGIVVQKRGPWWVGAGVAVVTVALSLKRYSRLNSHYGLSPHFGLFFFAGITLHFLTMHQHYTLNTHLAENKKTFCARVVERDTPTRFVAHVYKIKNSDEQTYRYASFNLMCTTFESTDFNVGTVLKISYSSIPFKPSGYLDYLYRCNVSNAIYLSRRNIRILERGNEGIFRSARNALLGRVQRKMGTSTFQLFASLFLGELQAKKENELRPLFGFWGISHFLARSGLHVLLFVVSWRLLLLLLPTHIFAKDLLLALMCLIYSFLSWPSISFIRALMLFYLYTFSRLVGRQKNFVHLACIITLITLCFHPLQLFSLAFQLSFALAFALGALTQNRRSSG